MNFKPIIQSMRGPFLVLTPVCVFLGVSTVIANQATVNFQLLALALLGPCWRTSASIPSMSISISKAGWI